jgi:hypothetical protein
MNHSVEYLFVARAWLKGYPEIFRHLPQYGENPLCIAGCLELNIKKAVTGQITPTCDQKREFGINRIIRAAAVNIERQGNISFFGFTFNFSCSHFWLLLRSLK